MPEWRIYYANGSVVRGTTAKAWRTAPNNGVQVVVLMAPYPGDRQPWRGVSDRQLWTGEDAYDPFGWGKKYGQLIPDDQYATIWERACGDR